MFIGLCVSLGKKTLIFRGSWRKRLMVMCRVWTAGVGGERVGKKNGKDKIEDVLALIVFISTRNDVTIS